MQTQVAIPMEGELECATCKDVLPKRFFMGTWGRLVSECEGCRDYRKMKTKHRIDERKQNVIN